MAPTLVLVPGSFAPAAIYTGFVDLLRQHGLETVVVSTPSVGLRDGRPPASMSDDVDAIQQMVNPLLEKGKDVVLLTHSYGGIPGTESLKALSARNRSGGVRKVIYLTSVILPVGISNLDLFGGNFPDFVTYSVSECPFFRSLNRAHFKVGGLLGPRPSRQCAVELFRHVPRRGSQMGETNGRSLHAQLQREIDVCWI